MIKLYARTYILGNWHEAEILDSGETLTLKVGSLTIQGVPLCNVLNVALKEANGEVVENFGKPNSNRPETLAYIRGYQNASQ